MMGKTLGFTFVSIVILAIGIGANTAMFSAVNALLLRPLPLREPGKLFSISTTNPKQEFDGVAFSIAAYETIRDDSRSFSSVAAYCAETFTLTGSGNPEQLQAARVSANFFHVLDTQPFLGRGFLPAEGGAAGNQVVLISHNLWQRHFGSNSTVLGKSISLNHDTYTIVGVMPAAYPFPSPGIDAWVTKLAAYTGLEPEQIQRGAGYLSLIGRLNSGISIEQARSESAILYQNYRHTHPANPDADPDAHIDLVPLQDLLVTSVRPTLIVLTGAVGLVLLIACANLAGLLLARSTSRNSEIAVRMALGASRIDLVRQLLIESVLLSITGGALGVLLANWVISWQVHSNGGNLPNFRPIRLDGEVLLFTLATSIGTGLVFGLMPAILSSRSNVNGILRDSGRGNTAGVQKHFLRDLLVTGQIALSVVLLIAAGLLVESFQRLQSVNPGFSPQQVLSMHVDLPPAKYEDNGKRERFLHQVIERLEGLPGVLSATAGLNMPGTTSVAAPVLAEGQPSAPVASRPLAQWTAITPGYFKTLKIPMLRGRDFDWRDDEKSHSVAIINSNMARRLFRGQDPVGKHLTFGRAELLVEIVGIVGDVKNRGLNADSGMIFYTAYGQRSWPGMAIAIRTINDPRQYTRLAPAQVFALDSDQPVTEIEALEDDLASGISLQRQTMFVVTGFAGIAMLLAVVGLYGIMAYSVAQRTLEIGIRQAIGAQRGDVISLVLGHALRLTLAGVAIGAILAGLATKMLSTLLYHVSAVDPWTYGLISLLFAMVAMGASFIPAFRATRIDPITALRA